MYILSLLSISNRASLAKAVHIEKLMKKNKVKDLQNGNGIILQQGCLVSLGYKLRSETTLLMFNCRECLAETLM